MSNTPGTPPPPQAIDPQIKSVLTSILLMAATGAVAWAVHAGIISVTDQPTVINAIVVVLSGVAAAAVTWYKARQVSPKALITAVNAGDNGAKVVDARAQAPMITEPVKGSK